MENGEKTAARLEALTAGGDAEELANPYPRDTVAGRAWWEGYNKALRQKGHRDVAQAGQIAALREEVRSELESALCAPEWSGSLAHIHNVIALLAGAGD